MEHLKQIQTDEQALQLFKETWPQNKQNLSILKKYTKKFFIKLIIDLVISAGNSLNETINP
jgi:hypothetical protein